jgi:hypothetical protein
VKILRPLYDTKKSKLPNEKGMFKLIVSHSTKLVAVVAPSLGDLCNSLFPSVEWDTAIPALTHQYQQYMVEDCLRCDVNHSLLLLISPKHPSLGTGWQSHLLAIYQAFSMSAPHFHDGGVVSSVEV